jgi:hypothetical protein
MSADLTPEDLERIEEAAQLAHKTSETIGEEVWYSAQEPMSIGPYGAGRGDLELIAACDPQTILALVRIARVGVDAQKRIAELEEALRELVTLRDGDDGWPPRGRCDCAIYEYCPTCLPADYREGGKFFDRHKRWPTAWAAARSLLAQGGESSPPALSRAASDVLEERKRQVEEEGWTPEHDDEHGDGSLALAAACYASNAATWAAKGTPELRKSYSHLSLSFRWPWSPKWWKPKSQRHDLVRAGALILAEIERLDRAQGGEQKESTHGA